MAEVLRAASERHVELSGGGDSGEPLKAKLITWPEDWHSASKVTLEAVFGTRTPARRYFWTHGSEASMSGLRDPSPTWSSTWV